MNDEHPTASRAHLHVVPAERAEGARVLPFRRPRPAPTVPELYELAWDAEEEGSPAEAIEAYRRVLTVDAEHPGAHVNLGRLLHAAGDVAAAQSHYLRALAAAPEDAIAWYNLAVALEQLERADEALAAYERALRLDSSMLDAHENAARVCEKLGRSRDRLRHLSACYRAMKRR